MRTIIHLPFRIKKWQSIEVMNWGTGCTLFINCLLFKTLTHISMIKST